MSGFEIVVLLADLHAFLNRKGTMAEVRDLADYNRRCFEGLGLKDVTFVLGSDLQLNPDYELLMLRLSQQITLNRATRSMDEVGRQMDAPTVSQMIYPIMQMVDIAMLGVDAAVGGLTSGRSTCSQGNTSSMWGLLPRSASIRPSLTDWTERKCPPRVAIISLLRIPRKPLIKNARKHFVPLNVRTMRCCRCSSTMYFPGSPTVTVRRPEKFGGDREFNSYHALEECISKRVKFIHSTSKKPSGTISPKSSPRFVIMSTDR